ncbi:putative GntR-family transcriptional regulator [metagenome]|uniref:Putative GntR-family transcriptional regulator n=1 Tax=metagenome TaxID=256318 RepID=A0A2P2CE06_9ZZZZ
MPVPQRSNVAARTLLRDRAYVVLRDAIVDGTLAPGEQLREGELETWLGVSRTPIREALMRLQRSGLVLTRPGHSTVVAPLDDELVHAAQPVVAAMHELAVRLAVPRLGPDRLEALRDANREFAQARDTGDATAALAADDRLHQVYVDLAANPAISDILEQYSPLLRRIERLRFSSAAGHESVALHEEMIEASAAGDVERAAATALTTWASLGRHRESDHQISSGHGLTRAG